MNDLVAHQVPIFPALNACLNSLSFALLLLGLYFIKNNQKSAHKKAMLGAVGVSAAFLVSYLYYHFNYPPVRLAADGALRAIYLFILLSHIVLAVVLVPCVLKLLWTAFKNQHDIHKKWARWVLPIWLYTSFTGVLVYFFLYVWFPGSAQFEVISK
jgi:putative membrane protein